MPAGFLQGIKIMLILGLVLCLLLPIVFLFSQSFAFGWRWPQLLPAELNWRAWAVLFREPSLLPALKNTMLIGGWVVFLNLILAWPAGKALAHSSFPGKNLVEAILMGPILIPSLALGMGLHLTMLKLGLANKLAGVVLVHLIPSLPYSVRILRAGFENAGVKWEEQAKSLGANARQIMTTVYFPLLLPSLRSGCVLAFVISLSQYALTAIIGGGNVLTLAMIYYPYFLGADRAVIAAFSAVFALMPILFLLILELLISLLLPGGKEYLAIKGAGEGKGRGAEK